MDGSTDKCAVDLLVGVPALPRQGQKLVRLAAAAEARVELRSGVSCLPGGVDSSVVNHPHPPPGAVRELPRQLLLELLLSRQHVHLDQSVVQWRSVQWRHPAVVPARPDGVVYAEEDDHVGARVKFHHLQAGLIFTQTKPN